jgi:hypothetical protein
MVDIQYTALYEHGRQFPELPEGHPATTSQDRNLRGVCEMTDQEVLRSGLERREGYCPMHSANTKRIGASEVVAGQHTGQWKILLWGLGIFCTATFILVGSIHQRSLDTQGVVIKLDKTVSSYIAQHQAESFDGFRRIEGLEIKVDTLHERMDKVEQSIK